MQKALLLPLLCFLFLTSCFEPDAPVVKQPLKDSVNPVITFIGSEIDTAYLLVPYKDLSVNVNKYKGCLPVQNLSFDIETRGYVDTRVPGTYTISYKAVSSLGDTSAVITRSVIVVPNPNGFLPGFYNVVCTCTATQKGATTPTITSTTYTAEVFANNGKSNYKSSALKIGADTIVAELNIDGDKIYPGFFNVNYHWNVKGDGTINQSRNRFTVNTNVYSWTPVINYRCKNIFTKQLTESSVVRK